MDGTIVVVMFRGDEEYGFIVEPGQENRQALVRALIRMSNDSELEFGCMDADRVLRTVLEIQQGATR